MTDLPADMGARFGLGNRQFRKGEAAQIDSSWTETPQEKANKKVICMCFVFSVSEVFFICIM